MEEALHFGPLLLVAGLAFIVPLLLSRFSAIPVVVGEIVAGIIIGRSGLQLVEHGELSLAILSEIGFAFLMFLSGLEIDFSILTRPRAEAEKGEPSMLSLAVQNFLATVLLAIPVGFLLVRLDLARDPWMMALILSTTSLGIVVPVLKERRISSSKFGQTVLLAALLADFATMLLITVYVSLYSSGLTIEILLIGILFIAFLITYRLGLAQIRRPAVRRLIQSLEAATSQIKVRGSIALMLAFVVLAEFVDVELILGAFLAGAVVSLLSTRDDEGLHEKMDAIGYGFFIPVFFIMVGVDFNLPLLLESSAALLLAPFLLIAAILIKILASLVFKRSFDWRQTMASGWLLSARLSLIIAAAAIGLRIEVISESTNAAIIFVAALTSTLAPLVSNSLLPEAEEGGKRPYIIYSAANLGLQVGQELRKHGESVLYVEPEELRAHLVRKEGFEVLQADGDANGLSRAEISKSEGLLALSGDDERNFEVAKLAIEMGQSNVLAMVQEPTRLPDFRSLGIQATSPTMLRPMVLASMARNPDLFKLLTSSSDEQDIREIAVRNRDLVNRPISELVFPGDSLILTIRREGEVRVPHGSTQLQYGDHLTVLGELDSLEAVRQLLEG